LNSSLTIYDDTQDSARRFVIKKKDNKHFSANSSLLKFNEQKLSAPTSETTASMHHTRSSLIMK
jgi:hypothetical protein